MKISRLFRKTTLNPIFSYTYIKTMSSKSAVEGAPKTSKPQIRRIQLLMPKITNELMTKNDFIDAGSLSILPVDVINFIMHHLSIRDLYRNLSLSNKALFVLVRSMDLQNYTVDMSTALVSKRTKNQRVLLDAISKINNHDKIRSIIIGKLDFGKNTWANLHKLMPDLRDIHFRGTGYVHLLRLAVTPNLVGCSKITSFTWETNYIIADFDYGPLFTYLGSALKHLVLRETVILSVDYYLYSADRLLLSLSSSCPNLRSLHWIGNTGRLLRFSLVTINTLCTRCVDINCIMLGAIVKRGNYYEANSMWLAAGALHLSEKSLSVLKKGLLYMIADDLLGCI